jgi:hypothetical protein
MRVRTLTLRLDSKSLSEASKNMAFGGLGYSRIADAANGVIETALVKIALLHA